MKNNLQLFVFIILFTLVSVEGFAGGACSPSATNTSCASAVSLVINDPCVAGTSCNGGAATATSCTTTGMESAWYSFVATNSTQDITIQLTASDGCHMRSSVFSSTGPCAGLTEIGCQTGAPNDDIYNFTTLIPGNTYYVQVVYNSGGSCGNAVGVCIGVAGPAAANCTDNEDCLTPAAFPLNAPGGGASCISDCNTAATAGPNFSGNNCYDLPNATVWYSFTTDAAATTIDINLSSTTDLSDPEFTLFTTPDCSNFTIIDCVEGTSGSATSTGLVVTPSTSYILAVSDATGDVGDFDLCVTQAGAAPASCVDNEDCSTPATIAINPTGGAPVCVADCNTGASGGPIFTGPAVCQDMPNETVWYSFTTAADAATIDITLTSSDLSEPEFAVYTNVCGPFTFIDCVEGTGGSASITGQGITASTTYLIAVSDVSGDEGVFNLCVSQAADNSACNVDNVLSITNTSLGSPLDGPYAPGEVVTFCYTINSYITGIPSDPQSCNYISGIVPTFGDCWAPASFDADGMPVLITTPLTTIGVIGDLGAGPPQPCEGASAGTWSWFPSGSVSYNLSTPNPLGLTTGDDVGAGWFFTTFYESPGGACSPSETNPNSSYGDNNFPACDDLGGWNVCFSLVANNATDCLNGETNCNVSVKTFSDGEVGVWANIGCTADILNSKAATMVCVILSNGLEAFSGIKKDDLNHLSWTISEQYDVDLFTIERSSDGIYWNTLDFLQASPNTTDYSYVDNAPFLNVTYYRLKIKNVNGDVEVSQVIAISSSLNKGEGLISELHPVPTSDVINFTYTGANPGTPMNVKITNMVGQTIIDYTLEINDFNQKVEVNTASLAEGIYYVNISQGLLKTVKRISIVR
jgi:hypothetical protein